MLWTAVLTVVVGLTNKEVVVVLEVLVTVTSALTVLIVVDVTVEKAKRIRGGSNTCGLKRTSKFLDDHTRAGRGHYRWNSRGRCDYWRRVSDVGTIHDDKRLVSRGHSLLVVRVVTVLVFVFSACQQCSPSSKERGETQHAP